MSAITTFEILDQGISKAGGRPAVLEALWDGDTQNWYLLLFLYTTSGYFFWKRETRHFLGNVVISEGMDTFTHGKWTIAELAKEFAQKAIDKYNLTFYFPSEDTDLDCPKWTDRHMGINCADCNKLIIPSDSPYLPKDVCRDCHHTREQNERIRNAAPYDDGINLCMSRGDECRKIAYCTHFKDLAIAPFVSEKVHARLTGRTIDIVSLNQQDLIELSGQLENALDRQLENYQKPEVDELRARFFHFKKYTYKGKEYEMELQFSREGWKMASLIEAFHSTEEAVTGGYNLKLFFKKGITSRDDSILRFVRFVSKGSTDMATINKHYAKVLTADEVMSTLKKLEQIDCLTITGTQVAITQIGQNIL
jgi:hypothetical protein